MRGRSRHHWLAASLAVLLWLTPGAVRADEHDGEDSGGDITVEEVDSSVSNARGSAPAVIEERAPKPGANLRDANGKLTAPPNFRIASVVYEDRLNPKATPAPQKIAPPPADPKVAIENIPTYSGGAPSAVTGFIGVELTVEDPKKDAAAKPSFQNGRRHADTGNRIRSAIDGTVEAESADLAKEALRNQLRMPAAVGP